MDSSFISATLLLFLVLDPFGKHLLGVLQLSPTSLGIAGGVMLFLIALRMIFPMAGGMFGKVVEGETLTLAMLMSTLTLLLAARLEEFLGSGS